MLDELEVLEVPLDELEARARERRIYDVMDFCRGQTFQEAGYYLDESRGIIFRAPVDFVPSAPIAAAPVGVRQ